MARVVGGEQAVAAHAGLPLRQPLHRIRGGRPQVELDRAARAANIRGAFVAEAGSLRALRVALVDDVATTGATLMGVFLALFMANAGGAWDNAKKVVEVDLKEKGTPLHAATVIGDTVGDPFKDTSSVAMNPIIKFTTLFGLLAVELAVSLTGERGAGFTTGLAVVFFVISVIFVWRSFYAMRIKVEGAGAGAPAMAKH